MRECNCCMLNKTIRFQTCTSIWGVKLYSWTVKFFLWKCFLGRQPALGWHSRDTRRALAFHLGPSRVTFISLQLHLLFTCSSPIHTSFTCWFISQQSVQWMLHTGNWLIIAWRLASTKHSLILWFSAKALLPLVLLISFQCLSFLSLDSSQTLPGRFPFLKAYCATNAWTKEAHTHALVSHQVTRFLCLLKHFTSFCLCFTIFMQF